MFVDPVLLLVPLTIYYRLMSGLQASISTHIAKEYCFPGELWGVNVPLYVRAVGSHEDRLTNMYFAYLFLLRAVTKAGDALIDYPYNTGNSTDDSMVKALIKDLVSSSIPASSTDRAGYREALIGWRSVTDEHGYKAVDECRNGFDESVLFQVSTHDQGPQYWHELEEKHQLLNEFRNRYAISLALHSIACVSANIYFQIFLISFRFRNITRIMDCVTCEKCRVWGKLQILGLGTAIKVLLTTEEELASGKVLNRQEIIALINCLNQFSKSIEFASMASELEFDSKIKEIESTINVSLGLFCALILAPYVLYRVRNYFLVAPKTSL
jgi:Endoplasmic Reticulum Oxidoreductin 1 (ERO1)